MQPQPVPRAFPRLTRQLCRLIAERPYQVAAASAVALVLATGAGALAAGTDEAPASAQTPASVAEVRSDTAASRGQARAALVAPSSAAPSSAAPSSAAPSSAPATTAAATSNASRRGRSRPALPRLASRLAVVIAIAGASPTYRSDWFSDTEHVWHVPAWRHR